MSNERDELAQMVADADYVAFDIIADRILDAGYRKPRTITTVEELDALPDGSMVLDADPDALLRTDKGWLSVHDNDGYTYPSAYVSLPATVLYTPEVSK